MENKDLKVITIVGTRPEIIRLSRVSAYLDKYVNHKIIHTGQNYDYELNKIFYDELKLRKPDYNLEINTSSLGNVLGNILIKVEEVLKVEMPDSVLILGDTNSSIAAIIAKRQQIPVYHMEAGNRSFDNQVPEELNRKIIDHIADFNLVYTENSRQHLISEGLSHRKIYLTGSPMFEVLEYYKPKINKSQIIDKLGLRVGKYFCVSLHREENIEIPLTLKNILQSLENLASKYNLPIIISTHPRTRKKIKALKGIENNKLLKFHKPFGFFDYIKLQQHSLCSISDSGTISEESAILNFSAITIRNSLERPEALDSGSIILSGTDPQTIVASVDLAINEKKENVDVSAPKDYLIGNTSSRVLRIILGTSKLANNWQGIKKI